MQNKIILILTIILTSFGIIKAQVNIGSPYSRFGIGNLENTNIGRANGMGGIATGLRMPYEINPENPASYSAIPDKVFLFQSGFKAIRTDFANETEKVTDYNFKLNSINAALSINKFWGMSFGMNPLSTVQYAVTTEDSIYLNDYVSRYNNKYTGEGGLTKLYFGNAFVYKNFSAGINLAYIFGPLINTAETYLYDENYSSYVYNTVNTKIKAFHIRYGIQYSDSIFKKYKFTAGAYFENKTDLNASTSKFVSRKITSSEIVITDTIMNDTLYDGIIQMPLAYGIGFSLSSKKILLGIDYKTANWNDVTFFDEKPANLTKYNSTAFGIEYTEDYFSKKFIKKINWRFGGHYTNTELLINDTQIKDIGLNFGIGIPTKLGAKINLGFEAGKKGQKDNNLIQENYYIINFNINLADRWFIRRRFF